MRQLQIILLLSTLILGACYKDEGNYDYDPIAKIDMKGIEKEYSVLGMSRLQINPEFANKEDYACVWTMFSTELRDAPVDTISTDLNLDYLVTKKADNYTLALIVENLKNQDKQIFTSKVTVNTEFTNGWYVLKNLDGNTELDHINENWEVGSNILVNMHGSSLSGGAVGIAYTPSTKYVDDDGNKEENVGGLWVLSSDDGRMLRIDNLELAFPVNKAFYVNVPNQKYRGIQQGATSLGLYSDKGLFDMYQNVLSAMPRFGESLRISNLSAGISGSYLLSPISYKATNYTIYFDELNSRFLAMNNGELYRFSDLDRLGNEAAIKPNDMDRDILYMGRNLNNGYAVMANRTTSERYMSKLELNAYIYGGNYYSPILGERTFSSGMKVNQAQVFGHNAELPYIFYSTGSDLHMYDYDAQKETLNIVPSYDGEVTFIKHLYWRFFDNPQFNYFIVATEKGGRYKIHFYELLAGKPDLSKEVKVVEGEGSVKDLQFVFPNMPFHSHQSYPN